MCLRTKYYDMSIQKKRVDSKFRKIETVLESAGDDISSEQRKETRVLRRSHVLADADGFAHHKWRACSQANANYPVEISVMNIEGASVKNHIFLHSLIRRHF